MIEKGERNRIPRLNTQRLTKTWSSNGSGLRIQGFRLLGFRVCKLRTLALAPFSRLIWEFPKIGDPNIVP